MTYLVTVDSPAGIRSRILIAYESNVLRILEWALRNQCGMMVQDGQSVPFKMSDRDHNEELRADAMFAAAGCSDINIPYTAN
jgi:hypothetical protein